MNQSVIPIDNQEATQLYWKRISLISFVLAVFIVIRHNSAVANYNSDLARNLYGYLKYSITEIAVPMFFLISGFNFFKNYSHSSYKRKFKSRIKSLLVPYLSWNAIYCLFSIIISIDFFSRFFIGREKFIVTPLNVFLGCLFHEACNSHFWFVFDLMVCVLLNPVINYLLRNRIFGLSFLVLLYSAIFIFGLELPTGIFYRTDSFFYYYVGAFLGLHCSSFFTDDLLWNNKERRRGIFKSNAFYFALGIFSFCGVLLLLIPSIHNSVKCIILLVSAYGVWNTSACCRYISFKHLPSGGATFFIYASHGIIQPIVVKLLYLFLPKDSWVSVINFVLSLLITVMLCIGLRYFIHKFIYPLDKVLTGWRN